MPENEKNQGGCHTKKRKVAFFYPFQGNVWIVTAGQSVYCEVKQQSKHASKKWGALMKHSGIWLLFEQHLFVPKHVTSSQKMRLALLVSCALFLRSAGSAWQELNGRYLWISELRLEDLKTVIFYFWALQEDPTSHKVTLFSWTFLELLAYLVVLTSSELLSCVQGADTSIPTCSSEKSPIAWQSSCADTSPKWEVSTPCPKTKRTREDAVLKRETGHFSPLFKARCELLQSGQLVYCEVKQQSKHASKKWGALMKHSGRWLLCEQHLFVPKHVTSSQKMRLALLVSIPAPCFFDQQAVHDKNSKGDNCGFPNWDWKISKE